MDTSTIVNLGLLVISGVAAAFAGWQAFEARGARDDAQQARNDAKAHEEASLKAAREAAKSSTRSAEAAERQAAAQEQALHDRDPWRFDPAGQNRWKVTNRTGSLAYLEEVTSAPGTVDVVGIDMTLSFIEVANGASFFINFGGGVTDPASTDVTIEWFKANEGTHFFTHTIP